MSEGTKNGWFGPASAAAFILVCAAWLPAQEAPGKAKEGERCGTIRGITCGPDLWCDLQAGACKGADLGGICVKPGERCDGEGGPVCGCDGKTYSSDCERIKARTQKDHSAACTGQKQPSKG